MLRPRRLSGFRSGARSLCCFSLLALSPASGSAQGPAPKGTLAATHHDFGTVRQGERIGQVFTVRNEGTAPLSLQLVRMALPGMTARFAPEIAPGAQGTIRLEWDTGRVAGRVEGTAVLRTNDPLQPEMTLMLRALVQPPIEFQPFGAAFLSAYRGEHARSVIRIVNHEDRPLKIVGLESTSHFFTAAADTVEAGKVYDLQVTVKPDAPFGRVQEPLYVLTDSPAHERLRILVNVLIKADVYANPETVDFGEIRMAATATRPGLLDLLTQTFLVKARSGNLQLKSVHSDLNFLDLRQSPAQGKSDAFRIDVGLLQPMLRPGSISGSIHISTDDPRFPEITIPVRGEIR